MCFYYFFLSLFSLGCWGRRWYSVEDRTVSVCVYNSIANISESSLTYHMILLCIFFHICSFQPLSQNCTSKLMLCKKLEKVTPGELIQPVVSNWVGMQLETVALSNINCPAYLIVKLRTPQVLNWMLEKLWIIWYKRFCRVMSFIGTNCILGIELDKLLNASSGLSWSCLSHNSWTITVTASL